MHNPLTAGYFAVVVDRDGRILDDPSRPTNVGTYPWQWCWDQQQQQSLREAFVQACMFREPQNDVPASFRVDDRLVEYRAWLTPVGNDLVICRLVRTMHGSITEQQQKILSLVAGGATNAQIAEVLGIQESTVRSHLSNLRRNLNVARPESLILAAVGVVLSDSQLEKEET